MAAVTILPAFSPAGRSGGEDITDPERFRKRSRPPDGRAGCANIRTAGVVSAGTGGRYAGLGGFV